MSSEVTQLLLRSPALLEWLDIAKRERSLLIEGLWDAPKAALLALLRQNLQQPILVITGGLREQQLLDDCPYFGLNDAVEFPAWDTLPGEDTPPNSDIVGRRLEILYRLLQVDPPTLLMCPLQACLQKTISPTQLKPLCRLLHKGEEISFESLPVLLAALGYKKVPIATDKGEYAVRGGILDLFPVSTPDPYRLEFFGDTLEEIRIYDPISQKSISKTDTLFLAPANEYDLLQKADTLCTLLAYFPSDPLLVFDDLLSLEDRYVALRALPGAHSRYFSSLPELLSPHTRTLLFANDDSFTSSFSPQRGQGGAYSSDRALFHPTSVDMAGICFSTIRWHHPFVSISQFFSSGLVTPCPGTEEVLTGIERLHHTGIDLHFVTANPAEEHHLRTVCLQGRALPTTTTYSCGYLSSGFALADSRITWLPMTELTQRRTLRRQKWRSTHHADSTEFQELFPGDIVVHFQQGIGRYLGIEHHPNHLGVSTEFLVVEYADAGKLFVPMQQAHLLSRYIGSQDETPTFHTIGGKQWARTKARAEQAIVGYAHDLLRYQAQREVIGGTRYPEDSTATGAFEAEFPYEATDDQLRAIAEIKQDMCSDKAMDRLICGDVGYGKTEVAMRAAFKAVVDGKKQVAILVPTTVLALQHYETFSARMANFPIRIAAVSRFHTPKTVKKTLIALAEGDIDILIGTHRLISQDVQFARLGLIIIDEEQRFGVRAKEYLKKLKTGVDCITLSATPIPRTLYMSLIGVRAISVINTPPHDRLPVKTLIAEHQPEIIRNALLRELSRDGQAYFIHNRVETIGTVQTQLQAMLPEARIVVGHGQMTGDALDTVFHTFKNGDADILIATTIIENGVDIPNANTILINRADTFGLADLYQMRGRVGRWNRPAYAYFLIPPNRTLPDISRRRLHALVDATGYGGGMKIALRDLEIRGAGDILGVQQSGHIAVIGFHLYCKLLRRAVDALRNQCPLDIYDTKLEFPYDARLPEEYIGEPSLRIQLYHRLGDAQNIAEIDALLTEMIDRFGTPPDPALWLIALTRIKALAATKQVLLLKFVGHTLTVERIHKTTKTEKTFLLKRPTTPTELEAQIRPLLNAL